jgi:hypothetical protein
MFTTYSGSKKKCEFQLGIGVEQLVRQFCMNLKKGTPDLFLFVLLHGHLQTCNNHHLGTPDEDFCPTSPQ